MTRSVLRAGLLAAAIVATVAWPSAAQAAPIAEAAPSVPGDRVATETVNIRTGPGVTHHVLSVLPRGQHISATREPINGWVPVTFRGQSAYISERYLADPSSGPAVVTVPTATSIAPGQTAIAFAQAQLGRPYRFGATGPTAYDCSGLALSAWRAAGISLPRTSQAQFAAGHQISRSELQPGDLVFFYGSRPGHVGLYVGNGQIIHAPRPGKAVQYAGLSSMPFSGAVRPGIS